MKAILTGLALLLTISVLAKNSDLSPKPRSHLGQVPNYTVDYQIDFHGMMAKFGTFNLYDLDKTDELDWDLYTYEINCSHSKTKPRHPFLIYDRKRDWLFEYDIMTGQQIKLIRGREAIKKYPAIFLYQPDCPK